MGQLVWSGVMVVALSGAGAGGGPIVPDLSGEWVLAQSDAGPKGEVSGAVFNCGVACTIIQTEKSLTVSRSATADGKRPADTVVALDGETTGNIQAKWDGDKLVLTRAVMPTYLVTQTISRNEDDLVMVITVGEGRVGPFKLTYSKK